MEFLGVNRISFARVFTKSDKLSSAALKKSIETYDSIMLDRWESLPSSFITSAVTGKGRNEILEYIEESLNKFSNPS
jgi:GTP-binding protein